MECVSTSLMPLLNVKIETLLSLRIFISSTYMTTIENITMGIYFNSDIIACKKFG